MATPHDGDVPPDERTTRDADRRGARPPSGVPSPAATELEAGRLLGSWRLLRPLGVGGFSEVWEAEHSGTGRRVALKVLSGARDASREAVARFEQEGRLTASLSHPRCVYVFSAEQLDGLPAIAMELANGGTLADLVAREGPLAESRAVDLILDVLEGLEAAASFGILHRDVKPSNCFLDDEGRARIGDFGISRSLETDVALTQSGTFVGTPAYASPEQVRGQQLDLRSDLYSVGATLRFLMTGHAPHERATVGDLFIAIGTEPPDAHDVDISAPCARALRALLEKEPSRRPSTHAEARALLLPASTRGSTPASRAARVGALLLDLIPVGLLLLAVLLAVGDWPSWVVRGTAFLVATAWFAGFEWLMGATPGKRLLGLRVTDVSLRPAGPLRVLVRTLAFLGIIAATWQLADMTLLRHDVLPDGVTRAIGAWLPVDPVGLAWLPGLMLVTAPLLVSSRGLGLHDRLSGTRVRLARLDGARASRTRREAPASRLELEGEAARRGPYRLTTMLGTSGDAALMLGRDDVLGRDVWILERGAGDPVPTRSTRSDPNRVQWLQSGEHQLRTWHAYGHPGGDALTDAAVSRGGLPWGEARVILLDLLEALRRAEERDDAPAELGLDHLWLDEHGRLRLLDFAMPRAGEAAPTGPRAQWSALVHQALLLATDGVLVPPAVLSGRTPRAILPEHAENLARAIASATDDSGGRDAIERELAASLDHSSRVTRRRRVITLAWPVALLLAAAATVIIVAFIDFTLSQGPIPLTLVERRVGGELARIDTLRASGHEEEARAREVALAWEFTGWTFSADGTTARFDRSGSKMTIDTGGTAPIVEPDVLGRVEALRQRVGELTPEQAAEARHVLRDVAVARGDEREARRWDVDILPSRVMREAGLRILALLAVAGLLSTASAAVFRGGALLRLNGLAVRRSDGRASSRARCAARAAIAWSPVLVPFLFCVVLALTGAGAPAPRGPFADLFQQGGSSVGASALGPFALPVVGAGAFVLIAGVVAAVSSPERGWHDRLAGTRLVPR